MADEVTDLVGAATPAPETPQTPETPKTPEAPAAKPWFDALPEDVRTAEALPVLQKYKTQEDAVRGLLSAQKIIGKKGIIPPGADASDEEKAAFEKQAFALLGVPEKPEAYEWTPPDGLALDEAKFAEARTKLHSLNMNPAQFKGVMDLYAQELTGAIERTQEQLAAERETAVTTLKQEWGDNFDTRLQRAQSAIKKFGMTEKLKTIGLGNNLDVIKMFDAVAASIAEDHAEGKQRMSGSIDDQIAAVKASKEYQDGNHPEHQAAVDRVLGLYKQKVGG